MEMTPTPPRIECHMRTVSGKIVNPLALRPEDIDIHDIAHHLACINRFNGALPEPYSIAQHSVMVFELVKAQTLDLDELKFALLHDASEAYLGDVTKWLKASDEMRGYREAEARAMDAIQEAFALKLAWSPLVENADKLAVRYEAHLNGFTLSAPGYPALSDADLSYLRTVVRSTAPLPWMHAKIHFLNAYRFLFL